MRRYIILLLITGIVWAQTDFYDYDLPYDEYFGELVLKDGTTYLGEYSKTKEIYEQAYSKKLRQRKFNNVAVTCIVAGVIVALAPGSSSLGFSSSDFGYITDGYNP